MSPAPTTSTSARCSRFPDRPKAHASIRPSRAHPLLGRRADPGGPDPRTHPARARCRADHRFPRRSGCRRPAASGSIRRRGPALLHLSASHQPGEDWIEHRPSLREPAPGRIRRLRTGSAAFGHPPGAERQRAERRLAARRARADPFDVAAQNGTIELPERGSVRCRSRRSGCRASWRPIARGWSSIIWSLPPMVRT